MKSSRADPAGMRQEPLLSQVRPASADEAISASRQTRDAFFSAFRQAGGTFAGEYLAKPICNRLSPGCLSCMQGRWACIYLNGLCSRNCFFCPQDRSQRQERLPFADSRITFPAVEECSGYLRAFDFDGVGFSGGEPLLEFELLLDYCERIRKDFGPRHYLWVYTNGDLLTREKCMRLKDAGVAEIRFDLAARQYDLKPVEMAMAFFDAVTIELPVIPEDCERLQESLRQFAAFGGHYVNLHQLMVNRFNADAMARRGYTVYNTGFHRDIYPVLESELTARDILLFCRAELPDVNINYCTETYKELFQGRALRTRYAPMLAGHPDAITPTGFVRRFFLVESGGPIRETKESREEFTAAGSAASIAVEGSTQAFMELLNRVRDDRQILVVYYAPKLVDPDELKGKKTGGTVTPFPGVTAILEKRKEYLFNSLLSARFFARWFMMAEPFAHSIAGLREEFCLAPEEQDEVVGQLQRFYQDFTLFEFYPHAFAPIGP